MNSEDPSTDHSNQLDIHPAEGGDHAAADPWVGTVGHAQPSPMGTDEPTEVRTSAELPSGAPEVFGVLADGADLWGVATDALPPPANAGLESASWPEDWDDAPRPRLSPPRLSRRRKQSAKRKGHRAGTLAVVAASLLFAVLIPSVLATIGGIQQYNRVRAEASDAVAHLRTVESLLASERQQLSLPDASTLLHVQNELQAAHIDFTRLHQEFGTGVLALGTHAPRIGHPINTAATLVMAGDEASLAGLDGVNAVETISHVLQGGIFSSAASSAAGLDASTLALLTSEFESMLVHLNLAVASLQGADLGSLPSSLVSPQELALLHRFLAGWPGVQTQLTYVDAWLHVAPSILGVQAPEQYLLELMDRSELRPTGGFIGNYAVMTIQQGRIQPFTLRDIYLLDDPYVAAHGSPSAPPAYPWWPYSGFALRDSNVSADFPTTARLGIQLLAAEGGPHTQDVIALTSTVIASVITIVGPIQVPAFHQTVTASNLDALIHYYQETEAYQAGSDLPPTDQVSSLQKRFTALLGQALIARLHGLTTSQLIAIAKMAAGSLRTKDIQVYLSDPSAEALLAQDNLAAAMAQGPDDAVTIVDTNISANKANLFTVVSYTDQVQLDTTGTATHRLTITYRFTVTDASMAYLLFGRDYYTTYLRVYVPPGAQIQQVDGFAPGTAALDASDQPGRKMWGGRVRVLEGVPYTLHLVWTVPQVARETAGHWLYLLDYQHQAGSSQQLQVVMVGPAGFSRDYAGALTTDQVFGLSYQSKSNLS